MGISSLLLMEFLQQTLHTGNHQGFRFKLVINSGGLHGTKWRASETAGAITRAEDEGRRTRSCTPPRPWPRRRRRRGGRCSCAAPLPSGTRPSPAPSATSRSRRPSPPPASPAPAAPRTPSPPPARAKNTASQSLDARGRTGAPPGLPANGVTILMAAEAMPRPQWRCASA